MQRQAQLGIGEKLPVGIGAEPLRQRGAGTQIGSQKTQFAAAIGRAHRLGDAQPDLAVGIDQTPALHAARFRQQRQRWRGGAVGALKGQAGQGDRTVVDAGGAAVSESDTERRARRHGEMLRFAQHEPATQGHAPALQRIWIRAQHEFAAGCGVGFGHRRLGIGGGRLRGQRKSCDSGEDRRHVALEDRLHAWSIR